ncbi:tetratricopeptide repeat protein [Alkalibacillus aidingensis]|uniref:tetratricopeptide repeat protein n=1 Tax=Alkalibacillus aidingensis TaxID=2747607 RepID=UPI0016616C57|nr:tetratricopeptide repeat protein [Alkalibacillus aidingensis]
MESYYWNKFYADYLWTKQSFHLALKHYQEAESYFHQAYISQEEQHDLIFCIATIASALKNNPLSYTYTKKALRYYQEKYDLYKCAECHNLLGIIYQRANLFEQAEDSYQNALMIANQLNIKRLISLCYQNIGKLHTIKRESEQAIHYYKLSYKLRKEGPTYLEVIPISSLMKEYYQVGKCDEAKHWLTKGLSRIKDTETIQSIYIVEFKVYQKILNQCRDDEWAHYIKQEVLPFFEKQRLYEPLKQYLKILGDYYYDNRKYKLASEYFSRSSDIPIN